MATAAKAGVATNRGRLGRGLAASFRFTFTFMGRVFERVAFGWGLVIEQERRAINQRPSNILRRHDPLIAELFLAQVKRPS